MKVLSASLAIACAVCGTLDSFATVYGVCAHVTRDEYDERLRAYDMIAAAGFKMVRSDFDWWRCQNAVDGDFDFSFYDTVVDDAAGKGLTILPILYGPPNWAQPVHEHIDQWRKFVRAVAYHFKGRIPAFEIWNEENIDFFWHNPSPSDYASVLIAANEAIKSVDPKLQVIFGGTAGCDVEFIEQTIRAGAKDAFDAVNVHPYRHPNPPEPGLSEDLSALKEMMARNRIEEREIWITEMGWPTMSAKIPDPTVLRTGLKIAEPKRAKWRAAYLDLVKESPSAEAMAQELLKVLPQGSVCEGVNAKRLIENLGNGAYDLVVFPFGEFYPVEVMEATVEFVRRGGTLVLMGGYPLYSSYCSGDVVKSTPQGTTDGSSARYRLRIAAKAWWEDGTLPETVKVFPTDRARAAGLQIDPAGISADRFLNDSLLRPGDRFEPILCGKDKNGSPAVAAAVYLLNSDMKGRVVVSTTSRGKIGTGSLSEIQQALNTVRAMKSAAKHGVDKYFIYEFRAVEEDEINAEHFFGLVHKDFSPKLSYEACRRFFVKAAEASKRRHSTERKAAPPARPK